MKFLNKKVFSVLRPVVVVLFGLQSMRVVLPGFTFYLREVRGLSSLALAPLALVVFSLSFVSVFLARGSSINFRIKTLVWLLGGVRILEIVLRNPAADLILAVSGVLLFGIYLPLEVRRRLRLGPTGPQSFVVPLLLGVALDSGLHASLGSLDLSWQRGWAPVLLTGLFALVLVLPAESDLEPAQGSENSGGFQTYWSLIAIGPWIFLQMQVFQNLGMIGSLTGWTFPSVSGWIWFYNLAGLLLVIIIPQYFFERKRALMAAFGVILVLALSVGFNLEGWAAATFLLMGQIAAAGLLLGVLGLVGLGMEAASGSSSDSRLPVFHSLGFILFVLIFFLYYASFDLALGFRGNQLLPWIGGLVGVAAVYSAGGTTREFAQIRVWELWPQVVMVVVPIGLVLTWPQVAPREAAPGRDQLRVMTYNLHQGFNTAGLLDIEAMAQVIETAQPDVIALQEVTRGWVINSSLDMLPWLSRRLELPYVWGPTDPPQWGNAVLSRYPIRESQILDLPPRDLSLRRGYIHLEVLVSETPIRIIATHLHHPPDGGPVREIQVVELLEQWAGAPHTILMGDLNATIDAREMTALSEAGLIESLSTLTGLPPGTYHSENPTDQIDYIWVTPDLFPISYSVPVTTASDHLPVIVDLEIGNP